jgi:Arylsulfotransferase (ASST)
MDDTYRVITTVRAGNGLTTDGHEFLLTPQNTALITSYHDVPYDLSPLGGPKDGQVTEGVVQEVDVATGRVLFEWHSLDHVPLADSYLPVDSPYDYFHINAVNLDEDGNLLISARHTWTVYKVDRHTGTVFWRLGGKNSTFALDAAATFAWQHDAEAAGNGLVRIFDNESGGAEARMPHSRVLWLHLDLGARRATLARVLEHPNGYSASAQGNAQALPNGDTFVGWGTAARVSEFDAENALLFDASPWRDITYRAYRFTWFGRPNTRPHAIARRKGRRSTAVQAVWNGATGVAKWRVLAGRSAKRLTAVRVVHWNGLSTAIRIRGKLRMVAVVAVDASGAVIARSRVVRVR